jgi:hypothetical protein
MEQVGDVRGQFSYSSLLDVDLNCCAVVRMDAEAAVRLEVS